MYDKEEKSSTARYSNKWWINQIEDFEKNAKEEFWDSGEKVIKRYLNKATDDTISMSESRRYNIFWANVQILKSALYATPPRPNVTRENGDAKDDVARAAALMLERLLQQGLTKSSKEVHDALKAAVEDRLLPGLGQVWHRYDHKTEKYIQPPMVDPTTGMELAPAVELERVVDEKVCTDYVNWRDFMWSPARRWDEVWWVARRVWMKRSRFIKRFGKGAETTWKEIVEKSDEDTNRGILPKGFRKGRAEVFEIWCLDTKKVYFCNRNVQECLDRVDDPLGLDNFWPCPPPLLATHSNESLFPRADYSMVQDQYEELDTLNERIVALTKALRVVGAYDADNPELARMISGPELAMIPVQRWAALGENGGMARAVEWFPIEQIANVLKELMVQRQQVISQIYELTSISDIMRGASNPRETARAQQLKAQYSSVRLQLMQQDVAIFVQHCLRLRAEIMSKHFEPSTLIMQSQIEMTDSAKYATQAAVLLKDYDDSQYRIEVSEESLSMADYNAEREMRIELITAIGQFLSQSAQMVQSQPTALPYMLRMVQWAVASFRGSQDIESVLDAAIKAAVENPPKPEGNGEAEAKAEAEKQKLQVQAQTEQMRVQMQMQTEQIRAQMQLQIERMREETKLQIAEMGNQIKLLIAQMSEKTKREIAENKTEGE